VSVNYYVKTFPLRKMIVKDYWTRLNTKNMLLELSLMWTRIF